MKFCKLDGFIEPAEGGECPLCGHELYPENYVETLEKIAEMVLEWSNLGVTLEQLKKGEKE